MKKKKGLAPSSKGAAENVKGKEAMERYINKGEDEVEMMFEKLFEQAEIARYSESERRQYEESKKDYWDFYSTMKTAEAKGEAKGVVKGRAEEKYDTARRMKAKGYAIDDIVEISGLTAKEIEAL